MEYTPFNSPVDFIHELSKADSLQAVLDTIAYWISHVFDADRASIVKLLYYPYTILKKL